MLPESLIAEPTVWSSSPRRFAVLWRPALIPAYAFIIAYLFMAGFVLHQSGIGQDVYVHGLISLFLWLGGYMVYSAYPNSGIVQSVTEK